MSTIKKINVNNVSYEIGSSSTSNIEVQNDDSMSNLNIGDENGNVIAEFKEGHIKTKNFDSRVSDGINFNGGYISFIGDSITEGWRGGSYKGVTPNRWTKVLSTMLNATENNVAVGGWCYSNDGGKGLYQKVDNMVANTKCIMVAAGTNDWGTDAPLGDLFIKDADGRLSPQTDTNTTSGGLHRMISNIRSKFGVIPIFVILPIKRANAIGKNNQGLYLEDYVSAIDTISKYYSIPSIDMWHNSQIDLNDSTYRTKFSDDGLHLNDVGYNYYAQFVAKYINNNYINFM